MSSKEVTRADRGEPVGPSADAEAEVTDPTAQQRPLRGGRSNEIRRELEAERQRPERPERADRSDRSERPERADRSERPERSDRSERPERQTSGSRPAMAAAAPVRPADFAEMPTQALDEPSLALSMTGTGTTQAPLRQRARRRVTVIAAAVGSALLAIFALWFFLRPEPAPPPAQVRLDTVPPGAKVTFDGKALPGVTPLTLPPMPAGTYQVVVSREGYGEVRASVAVPATGSLALAPLSLKALAPKEPPPEAKPPEARPPEAKPPEAKPPEVVKLTPAPSTPETVFVKLTLETQPVSATIFVDGQERGLSPQVVEAKAEQELAVKVTAPQYRALEQRVKVKAGPSQVEVLKLEPLAKPVPKPAPPPPEPVAPKALVRFAVTPWAEVTCNGRNLGTTPFQDVAMPVGTYQCKFYNPDLARTISRSIEVRSTPLNTVKVKF